MPESLVRYEVKPPAVILTIDRADKRNSLSRALIAEMTDAFRRAQDDPAARCVILTSVGNIFCAGMDLTELADFFDESNVPAEQRPSVWDDAYKLSCMFDVIYSSSKPTLAAVNGAAVAGGAGLMTVCDLAITVPDAKFGYPEVRRGLVAAMVLPHLLRHVGERAARYLLLTGELIDGHEAARIGLVNEVVPADQLLDRAMAIARSLAEGGPEALKTTKRLLHQFSHQAMSVEEGAKESAAPRLTDECQQGLRAFFGKQPTPWAPK